MTSPLRVALPALLGAAMLAGLAGCTQTHTFELAVRNQTAQPVMLWLTKTGGPADAAWAAPEELAAGQIDGGDRIAGVVVEPGKDATAGPLKAALGEGDEAILRIYANTRTLAEALATSRASPNRLDVPLRPGKNAFLVHEREGKLAADRVSALPPR